MHKINYFAQFLEAPSIIGIIKSLDSLEKNNLAIRLNAQLIIFKDSSSLKKIDSVINFIISLDSSYKDTLATRLSKDSLLSQYKLFAKGSDLYSILKSMDYITNAIKTFVQPIEKQKPLINNISLVEGFCFKTLLLLDNPRDKTHYLLGCKLGLKIEKADWWRFRPSILAFHFYYMPPLYVVDDKGRSIRENLWYFGGGCEYELGRYKCLEFLNLGSIRVPIINLQGGCGSVLSDSLGPIFTGIVEPEIDVNLKLAEHIRFCGGVSCLIFISKQINRFSKSYKPSGVPMPTYTFRIETGAF